MKKYSYYGNLYQDIKKSKKRFDGKYFLIHMTIQFIAMTIFGVILRIAGFIGNVTGYAGTFMAIGIAQGIGRGISEARNKSEYYLNKIADLYSDINLNFWNRALSAVKMKECIVLQKRERVIEDTDTVNPVLSDEEKLVTYFYLLDPKDQIQVLRQIKDEITGKISDVYLLEEEDLESENIEVPVEKINRLKSKRN